MKRAYFILLGLIVSSITAHAQWTVTGGNIYNSDAGAVNIGGVLTAKFNIQQMAILADSVGNSMQLSSISGSIPNVFQNGLWLVRNANGNDWGSVSLHDGIAIDVSYKTPHVNTRTWWERDPRHDIQSWGHASLTYLTINHGKVGIGTTNPQNLLDVNGTVHSKQVNIDLTGWSDFVFKPQYQLPLLTDVKHYIDQNQHLPEMQA